ncbi:MAG: hypothetical protein AB7F22_16750 [Reyranella sp.]|uniref:hypothetical protein n=1 Tax=Reyranella sp. TaxID=1929291 RepID=UPI003D0D5BEB
MIEERRDSYYGQTIGERVALVAGELAADGVGFWRVVSFDRQGFDLSGDDLTQYVRRNVLALLHNGAKPVIWVANVIDGRGRLPAEYGRMPDEIADATIAEWLREKENSTVRVWFALPQMCLKLE